MTWLDVGIIVVLLVFFIRGAARGLIREAFGLGGIVLAIYLGLNFSDALLKLVPQLEGEHPIAKAVVFLIVLIIICYLANLLGRLVAKAVRAVALGFIDRLLGAVLGFLEGFAFVGVVLYILSYTPFGVQAITDSMWGTEVLKIVSAFISNIFGHRGIDLEKMLQV